MFEDIITQSEKIKFITDSLTFVNPSLLYDKYLSGLDEKIDKYCSPAVKQKYKERQFQVSFSLLGFQPTETIHSGKVVEKYETNCAEISQNIGNLHHGCFVIVHKDQINIGYRNRGKPCFPMILITSTFRGVKFN